MATLDTQIVYHYISLLEHGKREKKENLYTNMSLCEVQIQTKINDSSIFDIISVLPVQECASQSRNVHDL